MKNIIKSLFLFLFMPSYWTMNNKYDKGVDKLINELMAKNCFVPISPYTAKLGSATIWISNHPYGSFCLYDEGELSNLRPSRLTIYRAKRKLLDDKINNIRKANL